MRAQIFIVGAFVLLIMILLLIVLRLRLRTVRPGQALVISGGRRRVVFTRAIVVPLLEQAELMDISTRTLVIEPEQEELMISKDNQQLRYCATVYLGVNKDQDDVLQVADALGCARASDPAALADLFRPKVVSCLRMAAHQFNAKQLQDERQTFQDQAIMAIGRDLAGFVLHDLVVDRIEAVASSSVGPFR